MAKNNKKKPIGTNFATLTPRQYVKQRARKLPIVKAYINSDFQENGLACVLIIRQQGGEKYLVGTFMVDVFCLGIKNSLFEMGLPEYELNAYVENYYEKIGLPYKEYDPNYAQNVVWGAFEYAEELGFAPTKYSDFDITQYILDPIDEVDFIEIEFGQDGKPLFIAGPHDNVQKIRNILTKKVGAEGYNFLHPMGNMMDLGSFDFDDDEEEEWDEDDNNGIYDDYEEIT
jgi:hypothetical protein